MINKKYTKKEALEYHIGGKVGMSITKACESAKDLSLAYSPGVAEPCLEIAKDEMLAYTYTNKANTIAVISNGTAVLGLGDIGASAAKPVMEGKGLLFKKFSNIDVVDLELDTKDRDEIVEICRALAPSFGGINLEDIKAPDCFYIEQKLQEKVQIPVMHDDQHGTAVISSAGLLNALEINGKKIDEIKVVVSGAGAAAIACSKMYRKLGVKHIVLCDSKGVVYCGRSNLSKEKKEFEVETKDRTLSDALKGADVFLGLSLAGLVSKEMIKSMAKDPIIFALANPTPEILPEEINEVRDDAIIGTGRSDYPNQINNVLGFPYIFRGALDVHATKITENMKLAAAQALANLAKQEVSQKVLKAYNLKTLSFSKDYIIPKPFDERALVEVASAVASAAIKDGVGRKKDYDEKKYREHLKDLLKEL
ncbi:malic enzyme-like NAD(P)-binding protein [Helicobacter cetorum]|uniref:malic enzyme-like NAD(P)-binding protein n=1 Tax=Helicobacter cetorum TaxID=138563 RepID=UPI000CF0DC9D|nr:malic enzyme-like NAD(P)-binding protein [Helicobacter cetorum]